MAALRPVAENERRARPKTVSEAAFAEAERELLVAMRTRIAGAIDNPGTTARDLAALTKRLMEVVRDIEAIDARTEQEGGASGETTDAAFDASAI